MQSNLTSIIGNDINQSFEYNGNGNRLSKTVDGETTYFANDLNQRYEQVLQTYDAQGNVIDTYTYGMQRINSKGETTETYLYDGRGSVVGTVGAENQCVSYSYTAYGELMPQSPQPKVFGYNGEQTDFSTGMQYLRARYYDTGVQRFVQEDAWCGDYIYPKSMNRYGYTYNNPVMYADDGGNKPIELTSINSHTMEQVKRTTQADLLKKYQDKKRLEIAKTQDKELQRIHQMKGSGTSYLNPENKVRNPYPYGPAWVSEEVLYCIGQLHEEEGLDIEENLNTIINNSDIFISLHQEITNHLIAGSYDFGNYDYEQSEANSLLSGNNIDFRRFLEDTFDEEGNMKAAEMAYVFTDELLVNGAKGIELDTYAISKFRPEYLGQEGDVELIDILRNRMSEESAREMLGIYTEMYDYGTYYEDITGSANLGVGAATGTILVISVDEGYVAQFVHFGPEVGIPGASLQLTTGTLSAEDRKQIEGWSLAYSISTITRHEASVSVFYDSYGDVTQTGNGIQTGLGATFNLSYYKYVTSYDFDLD